MLSDFILDLQEESPTSPSVLEMPLFPYSHSMPSSRKNSQATSVADSSNYPVIKQEKNHECHICQKSFTRRAIFLDHYRSQHSDERILCSICSKPFKRQNDRRRHEKLHSGERAFRCQGENHESHLGCGKRFARLHSLKEHQRRKPGSSCYDLVSSQRTRRLSSPPSVLSDPDSFSEDDDEDDEDTIMESIEPVEIACSPDYDMDYVEDRKPIMTPTTVPPHASIQSTHISWPSVMEAKMRHQVGRALAAAQQDSTQWASNTRGPIPSPTSQSMYHCWLCPSRYRKKESFELHLNHHTHELDERPYHCSHCGVDFSLMGHLSRHLPNCTGAFSLYRCNWGCGRSFSSKEDLCQHSNGPDDTGCYENVKRYEERMKAAIQIRLKQIQEIKKE